MFFVCKQIVFYTFYPGEEKSSRMKNDNGSDGNFAPPNYTPAKTVPLFHSAIVLVLKSAFVFGEVHFMFTKLFKVPNPGENVLRVKPWRIPRCQAGTFVYGWDPCAVGRNRVELGDLVSWWVHVAFLAALWHVVTCDMLFPVAPEVHPEERRCHYVGGAFVKGIIGLKTFSV